MQKSWSVWMLVVLELAQAAQAAELEPVCPGSRSGCVANNIKRDGQNIFFRVNNTAIQIQVLSSVTFTLECLNNSGVLDAAAMPSFREPVQYQKIYIKNCALGNASVAGWLRALNVREEELLDLSGLTESLRASHVAGLNISILKLSRMYTENTVRLEEDFFAAFQNLISLETTGVQYEQPPSGLLKWMSVNAMLTRLYEESVAKLTQLYLTEPALTDVTALRAAERLEILYLEAPAGELPLPPALHKLHKLTLHGWNVSQPQWRGSAALGELLVEMLPAEVALPPRWLSGSPRLRSLQLSNLRLGVLPGDLLHANTELRELAITNCGLTSDMITETLFYKSGQLEILDLSRNNLTALPSERVLARLPRLSELNLSYNQLRARGSSAALRDCRALRSLSLDHNPLGDTCAAPVAGRVSTDAWSWLRELPQLTALSLRRTGATRICRDWLDDMPDLRLLDLRDNLVTKLTFADLHPVRSPAAQSNATIRLQNNNITSVVYSADDYLNANLQKAPAAVKINSQLTCDCEIYLFALASRNYPEHVRLEWPVCAAPGAAPAPLRRVRLDALRCDADCGAGCRCHEVPARRGVLASCGSLPAELARPRPPGLQVVELNLTGAGLTSLPAASALPPGLRVLDLTNNSIERAAERDARALLASRELRLQLAGNPLQCRCGERDLVDVLLQYQEFVDFDKLSCSDGSAPKSVRCGLSAGVVALLGVLAALALAGLLLLGVLAHGRVRARLKVALRALGVRLPAPAAPRRRYDAFVSFAEPDARWVTAELVPALESAPRPRRLCLHYRDWAVGEFIPQQIAASVRDAHRTLLVVSDAFARSSWARAEFDEAIAVATREGRAPPLLLLLSPPAPASLSAAPALADYLRAATYLRADDPRFRHKLRQAVPASPAPF